MNSQAKRVQRTYLLLTLLSTLAASFIWGINTLFLLDAGLNNAEAFAANAFFTAGMVIFEVPTGALADTWGRRTSYLLGAATLLLSTLLYLVMWKAHAPLWGWAIASILLGLGFTFFSGATEAWLVDALAFTGYKEGLEPVMARGQVVGGSAMLAGSVAGGVIAQMTDLGVPVHHPLGVPRPHARGRVVSDEGPGLHAEPEPRCAGGDAPSGAGIHRQRVAQATGPLADAGGAVRRRGGHVRVLRAAAVSARAVGRQGGVRDRGAGRGDRGRQRDGRRTAGALRAKGVHPAHPRAASRLRHSASSLSR